MTSASTLTELTNEVTDEATLCEVPLDTESDDDTEDAEDEDAREEMVVYWDAECWDDVDDDEEEDGSVLMGAPWILA